MHCANPPCMHVCPTTATKQREDGLVTIDYDLCIGCSNCIMACPYDARSIEHEPRYAYGEPMKSETARFDPKRLSVATKCTFCKERIDLAAVTGQTPGVDPDVTPACVNSCISGAMHFGDINDPQSNVSTLLADTEHFRMHEELGNRPVSLLHLGRGQGMSEPQKIGDRMSPRRQTNWDVRAAANFICGGAGGGLLFATALASVHGEDLRALVVLALALVGMGLFAVWLEIGRPLRALNVYLNAADVVDDTGGDDGAVPVRVRRGGGVVQLAAAFWIAGLLGLVYVYCQARMLHANKGIPAWRHASCIGMIVATGLAEGAGLLCASALYWPGLASFGVLLAALVAVRFLAWRKYLASLRSAGVPIGTSKALNAVDVRFVWIGHAVPAVLGVAAGLGGFPLLAVLAGVLAAATGGWFKYTLVCRAAFTQGFALLRTPSRGEGNAGLGVQPGWNSDAIPYSRIGRPLVHTKKAARIRWRKGDVRSPSTWTRWARRRHGRRDARCGIGRGRQIRSCHSLVRVRAAGRPGGRVPAVRPA